MPSLRILLALHGGPLAPDLAPALEASGMSVRASPNMASTWNLTRDWRPDAVILVPRALDPDGAEILSLVRLADDPAGPAVLVVTDEVAFLEPHARTLDDFLPPGLQPSAVARRLRFSVARRQALARLAAERESLLQMTITDFKTGLYNDRHFHARCKEECSRAQRNDQPLGVLVIDFDDFKRINDEHDHAFGDHVLLSFARKLRAHLRDFDVPARTGGDEFAVLLPNTRLADAASIAERIQDTVVAETIRDRDHATRLSVSIGVASWNPAGSRAFDEDLAGADKALLRAKKAGRGGIWIFDGRVHRHAPSAGEQASSGKGN